MEKTLKELRRAHGDGMVTQRAVADAIGMTEPNYARVERGVQVPRSDAIRKLAEFFGVDPAELRDKLTSQVA